MKIVALALVALMSGCSFFESLPPVEMCVVYKGKKICAVKKDGKWTFSAELSQEERDEIVRDIEPQ